MLNVASRRFSVNKIYKVHLEVYKIIQIQTDPNDVLHAIFLSVGHAF